VEQEHRTTFELGSVPASALRRIPPDAFDIPDEKLRVTCHLFADHLERQVEVEQYWLDLLELPRSSICKSQVNVYSKYSQKKRQNKLPYGTARVCVNSTRVVQSIYGSIQEYGGFERPEWLG